MLPSPRRRKKKIYGTNEEGIAANDRTPLGRSYSREGIGKISSACSLLQNKEKQERAVA